LGKLNEIAQKAYECAVRRGKIDPDNDSNNNLHRDLLEEVAEVFECTGEKSPHIKEYVDVEEELWHNSDLAFGRLGLLNRIYTICLRE
jgi:hypothetical protein